MFKGLQFEPLKLPAETAELRMQVRAFVETEMRSGILQNSLPNSDFNVGDSPEFTRKLGERGWIGMTWPKEYGGGERSFLERYVVTEELLAAGTPVGAHWIADRQSGPLFLKFGTEAQKQKFLPKVAAGEWFFSIGMSEPDSGSDLASIKTHATKVDNGWLLNGSKIWSSGAHLNHYMITLVRTEPQGKNRHAGLSQFIVDLADSNVTITGIKNLSGDRDFNQVFFDDVFIADEYVIGEPGNGWEQVMSELGYERSGPERFLSAFRVLVEFVREVQDNPNEAQMALIGKLVANLITLRRMSTSVAGMLQEGKSPMVEAALIKDLGNGYERLVPELIRLVAPQSLSPRFVDTLNQCILHAPSFTLRGGTREILRGVIARGLGLR
ncbi:MAG: acyl-CoA dehydrogenase family protein [Pseudomonadales bacterium]|nr:acyl-CoA dehydrogenase family protein [Pseudomonadales bacterium]